MKPSNNKFLHTITNQVHQVYLMQSLSWWCFYGPKISSKLLQLYPQLQCELVATLAFRL